MCVINGIQENILCDFTVFGKLNFGYDKGHCVISCPSRMSRKYVS